MEFTARDRLRLLGGAAGIALSGCGAGSRVTVRPASGVTPPLVSGPTSPEYVPPTGIFRDTFRTNFVVGAAVEPRHIADGSADAEILKDQFNAITAENAPERGGGI